MLKSNARKLAEEKLGTSGLTLEDAKALGIEILEAHETVKLFPKCDVPALKLRYFDLAGHVRKELYRVRLLEQPKGSFGEQKDLRYLQPPATTPGAYLPRTLDWSTIVKDPSFLIVITEGELKAACATIRSGISTIGLGGVSSWKSSKQGWSLLPELEAIVWANRDTVICFDSDAATNPDIDAATRGLLRELTKRGAKVRIAQMPLLEGEKKTGLDDLILAQGSEAFEVVIKRAKCDDLTRALFEFNDRFYAVMDPAIIYDEQLDKRYDVGKFQTYVFANITAHEEQLRADGTKKLVEVPVAERWVKWGPRRQLVGLTYEPGKPRVTVESTLNCWHGWGCEPKKGDIRPWKLLLDHLFFGAEPEARWWFERWCLYPIRYPGIKLHSACGLWSLEQGLGKSMVGKTLGKVYGKNYTLVSQLEFESGFNGWAVNKQLVMVDDISPHDSRAKAAVFKKIITQDSMQVNEKFIAQYEIPDCLNYYLTSNHSDALYIEDKDRRFFIHEVTNEQRDPAAYKAHVAWLEGEGPAALLYYAQNVIDFGDFDPYARPPMTKAKQDMIMSVKGELDSWISELKSSPDVKLKLGQMRFARDLYTPKELVMFFEPDRKGPPVAVSTMGRRLRDYMTPAYAGNPLHVGETTERFYIVRNLEKWRHAKHSDLVKHITECRAKERGGAKY